MKKILIIAAILAQVGVFARMTCQEALDTLKAGNKRFMTGASEHGDQSAERRLETAKGQEPIAAILGCADSRVSPEIIFDQGIGNLFIVRVAGNVAGPIEIESLDYAADELHARLIVVLGHESCGAVNAVLLNKTDELKEIASLIEPGIQNSRKLEGDKLENAIKENAKNIAAQLSKVKDLKELVNKKELGIVAAYYNFDTGEVEILSVDMK